MAQTEILKRLEKGTILCAEGYIFELERRGYLQAGPYVPEVVLEYPPAVRELHREFLRAGAEVMVACTYYGYRDKVKTVGKENFTEELNRKAIRMAREVASEENALVAGNISNTWHYNTEDPESSEKKIRPLFEEQVGWAKEEGVDFIIAETYDHVGEALIALDVIKQAGLTAMVTYIPKHEKSLDGYTWPDACRALEDKGAEIVGFNCGRGPDTMYSLLEESRKAVSCYLAAQPVPYRTTEEQPFFQVLKEENKPHGFPLCLDPFTHTRDEMAEFARRSRDIGVDVIGICCGAGPHHVRSMAEALGRTVPASRYSPEMAKHPFLGSGKNHQDY